MWSSRRRGTTRTTRRGWTTRRRGTSKASQRETTRRRRRTTRTSIRWHHCKIEQCNVKLYNTQIVCLFVCLFVCFKKE